ncbi:MAG: tRNA guanosine(34) transglycosylase Tgt [Ginsengibacter sp.]
MAALNFQLQHTDIGSKARAGKISTDHGDILTPVFMPVGTVASVKAITQQQLLNDVKAQIILGNTYHLFLRPGMEIMKAAGGLHKFMGWSKPMLTDSGGYQVFSLGNSRKLTEEGAIFQNHINGDKHLFSPEAVIDIQRVIGADIIMAFDECPPGGSLYDYAKTSMELTNRWLDRCFERFNATENLYGYTQNLFPIAQGGVHHDLRKISCEYVSSKEATGNAIGGLSVGEPTEKMYEICELCCDNLPVHRPRYLMGVGTPWNIVQAIALGVDMFDCVMPTRNGRNAMLFTSKGVINIDNKKWEKDFSPIDDGIDCEASNYYSKAYLKHLFVAKEILALQIASIHNLAFYLDIVNKAREHIIAGDFISWKNEVTTIWQQRL